MAIRIKELPAIHKAVFLLAIAFFTVSQSPPKKIMPKTKPLANATIIVVYLKYYFCSFITQFQAIRQPVISPNNKKLMVQENGWGCFSSNHIPASAPMTVGTVIDHPTIPNILSPNQAVPLFSEIDFNFLFSFSAITLLKETPLSFFAFCTIINFETFLTGK